MKQESTVSISAFFPAYNDAQTIGSLVRTNAQIFRELQANFEIIVVNDGSQDDTAAVLENLKRGIPELVVVHHLTNRGYGAALISGFYSCTKEWIFYTDGDGQYDVNELSLLLAEARSEVDVVNGYKISRSDPFYRIWLGKLYLVAIHWTFGLKIRDVDCDYRLMRRQIFDYIQLRCESGVICVELMKKIEHAGYRIVEVPVHHYPRRHGRSQIFCIRHLSRVCLQLMTLWVRLILLRRYDGRIPVVGDEAPTK
ncbi:MAG: glycosyltransferase family 2 protein [Acidobacteria bacterium]|nr:glycosyltransferase family 2 protein [Acidobacteriota bacterium]